MKYLSDSLTVELFNLKTFMVDNYIIYILIKTCDEIKELTEVK